MTTPHEPMRDARPPRAAIWLLNPVMRALLRSPLGRAIRPLALLEFTGRRSGRRISVVVGWHAVGDDRVVFTPAGWRANFAGGADAQVRFRGRSSDQWGVLDDDPVSVAATLNAAIGAGVSLRALALRNPNGHIVDADDVRRTGRAVIRFRPTAAS